MLHIFNEQKIIELQIQAQREMEERLKNKDFPTPAPAATADKPAPGDSGACFTIDPLGWPPDSDHSHMSVRPSVRLPLLAKLNLDFEVKVMLATDFGIAEVIMFNDWSTSVHSHD